jgi:hypothetical protein
MPAWLPSGTRQRTKRLKKSASEGDARIDDRSGGSLLTIETGSDFGFSRTLDDPGPSTDTEIPGSAGFMAVWQRGQAIIIESAGEPDFLIAIMFNIRRTQGKRKLKRAGWCTVRMEVEGGGELGSWPAKDRASS